MDATNFSGRHHTRLTSPTSWTLFALKGRGGLEGAMKAVVKPLSVVASTFFFMLVAEHVFGGQPDRLDGYIRDADLSKLPNETDLSYAARMNRLVAEKSYSCSETETGLSLIERAGAAIVPAQLFAHGVLARERFNCGTCAAKAHVLKDILADRGIQSSVYYTQHVILRSGHMYFDPTFGVGPFKLADYRQAYRGVPQLSSNTSWDDIFSHPSGGAEEQGRWNAVVDMEEYMQGVLFKIADAVAVLLALAACVLLWLAIKQRVLRHTSLHEVLALEAPPKHPTSIVG